ncbi:hypothetical protein BANRA_05406 [Klebsiella pneumoniae]|uniref:hypothetical protein n=1 Tax=Klebsiella pneumoniae TaxID=573 RepID=UPI000F2B53A7|nr:hypothetical protein BANRA_05406 [Klebsiella pneumoniae]
MKMQLQGSQSPYSRWQKEPLLGIPNWVVCNVFFNKVLYFLRKFEYLLPARQLIIVNEDSLPDKMPLRSIILARGYGGLVYWI